MTYHMRDMKHLPSGPFQRLIWRIVRFYTQVIEV